jgi:ABC-2 type transport system permease protein
VTGTWLQVYHLARRSVVRQARQPANVVAPVVFPLALLAVTAGGLQKATTIPGFGTNRFVAFALAIPFMQGALFATMNAGTDLARDIQTGFFNRLSLTPIRGAALIVGSLAGIAFVAAVQSVVYLAACFSAGRSRSRSASAPSASSWRSAPARASPSRGSSRSCSSSSSSRR